MWDATLLIIAYVLVQIYPYILILAKLFPRDS